MISTITRWNEIFFAPMIHIAPPLRSKQLPVPLCTSLKYREISLITYIIITTPNFVIDGFYRTVFDLGKSTDDMMKLEQETDHLNITFFLGLTPRVCYT